MKTRLLFLAMFLMLGSAVNAQFIPCDAVFTYNVNPSGVANFTAIPTSSSSTQYFWTFGNGTSGTGMSATTLYNTVGSYTVCLYVVDSSILTPCSDSSCVTITVGSTTGCNANFTPYIDTSGSVPFTYYVNNTSTGTSLSYVWSWGDGTPNSTGPNPGHTFPGPGTYTICLMISNSTCTDTFCQNLTVPPASACSSSFVMNISPITVPFSYSAVSTSTGTGLSYTWIWGDGSPNSGGASATHSFPAPGTYNVCLAISNSFGCNDTSCQSIVVTSSSVPCNAMFSIIPDTSAGPGNYIGFNWSTGTGLTYSWSWGDGTPNSTGPYPSHTYATSGVYTICLTVTGSGCVDSMCITSTLKTGGMVTVNFQVPASVNTISKNEIQFYPNPADDRVYIKGNSSTLYQVEIYNVNGSKVLSTSAKGNEAINISSLPVNLYMVKVTDANGESQFAKFMKQ